MEIFNASTLHTTIDIFEADNIVLTQVRTRLNLNQFKRDHARILQRVNLPYRNVGRLIFGHKIRFITTIGDARRATDNPVFCAMVVHLNRKLFAGV